MVKFVVLTEWVVGVIGFVLIVTQIVIPAARGRPLFPLLRKRGLAVESKLAEVREEIDIAAREREIEKLRPAGQAWRGEGDA